VTGQIALHPTGEQGFGYDPVFIPDGHTQTFAELDLATKTTMSHRAKAFEAMTNFLKELF
jgi:XTP/dITP diphosphohydrolase